MTRRLIAVGVASLIAILAGFAWWIGSAGSTPLEEWIRGYLVSVCQAHLNTHLELGQLDYRYPRTVVISGLSLRTDDVTILAGAGARLELAEFPRRGKPLL